MKVGDPVTVALRCGGLAQTAVKNFCLYAGNNRCVGFTANDDDRKSHLLIDNGVTWCVGHVDESSEMGKMLLALQTMAAPERLRFDTLPMTNAGGTVFIRILKHGVEV